MREGKTEVLIEKRSVEKFRGFQSLVTSDGALLESVTKVLPCVFSDNLTLEDAFYRLTGEIYEEAAQPALLQMSILLPLSANESLLREIMAEADRLAKKEQVAIGKGTTASSPDVTKPVIAFTMTGKRIETEKEWERPKPGQKIIVTGEAALSGTAILTARNREKLRTRFSDSFLDRAERFSESLSVREQSLKAFQHGASAAKSGGEGGIFAALWDFSERSGCGFEADLSLLPFRQETIEICEFLQKNPYELMSAGMMLFAAKEESGMLSAFRKAQIPAVCIGTFTEENAKILQNAGEVRYLNRPGMDAVWEQEGKG